MKEMGISYLRLFCKAGAVSTCKDRTSPKTSIKGCFRLHIRPYLREVKPRLRGSLTVEAAYIASILLISLGLMIHLTFDVHDRILGDMVLNEAIELYGHSYIGEFEKEDEREAIAASGNERLGQLLSSSGFELELSGYRDGSLGEIKSGAYGKTMRDKGFKPHELMRKLTLIEVITK